MHWTKKIPTAAGWYWWRRDIGWQAIIVELRGGRIFDTMNETSMLAKDRGGEWYGPLVEPGGDAIENCKAQSEKTR